MPAKRKPCKCRAKRKVPARPLGSILSKCPSVRYTPVIHQGTLHGYALPDRDIYAKVAAERDWELIFAMYHRQIPPYAR
jgi:hypothetical protein